jgi:hypothetical protein
MFFLFLFFLFFFGLLLLSLLLFLLVLAAVSKGICGPFIAVKLIEVVFIVIRLVGQDLIVLIEPVAIIVSLVILIKILRLCSLLCLLLCKFERHEVLLQLLESLLDLIAFACFFLSPSLLFRLLLETLLLSLMVLLSLQLHVLFFLFEVVLQEILAVLEGIV